MKTLWIARDQDGLLYLYSKCPKLNDNRNLYIDKHKKYLGLDKKPLKYLVWDVRRQK